MRIRRCASKLLGLARAHPSSSSSLPPPAAAASPLTACSPLWATPPPLETGESEASTSAGAADELFCHLNRSPWDVMADLHLLQGEEGEEGHEGIPGNGMELEEGSMGNGSPQRDQPLSPALLRLAPASQVVVPPCNLTLDCLTLCIHIYSSVSNLMKEQKKKVKQKRMGRKGKEGKETSGWTTTPKPVVVTCKKSDGKGWHCKRPAQRPHTLCHYHLEQLRSYGCNGMTGANAAGDSSSRCRRKKANASGADANMCYYYYSGFGPWRGKTRGGSCGAGEEEEENARENSELTNRHDDDNGDDVDEDKDPAAGNDEESIDEDNGVVHGEGSESGKDGGGSKYEEKNDKCRKRGRKPVKARSLKSLL